MLLPMALLEAVNAQPSPPVTSAPYRTVQLSHCARQQDSHLSACPWWIPERCDKGRDADKWWDTTEEDEKVDTHAPELWFGVPAWASSGQGVKSYREWSHFSHRCRSVWLLWVESAPPNQGLLLKHTLWASVSQQLSIVTSFSCMAIKGQIVFSVDFKQIHGLHRNIPSISSSVVHVLSGGRRLHGSPASHTRASHACSGRCRRLEITDFAPQTYTLVASAQPVRNPAMWKVAVGLELSQSSSHPLPPWQKAMLVCKEKLAWDWESVNILDWPFSLQGIFQKGKRWRAKSWALSWCIWV